MNGLSLCAGIGGLDWAVEIAFPGYRTVAAVESNPQAARRFKLRFPHAKVFRDVVGFDGRPWRGAVDSVLAGWPCQPHSLAGQRRGTSDERWIWPDIARILGESEPALFFGENVPGLLRDTDSPDERFTDLDDPSADAMGGMGEVLRDLAALGFTAAWGSIRASDVGASHGRLRVFILAVAHAGCAEGRRRQDAHHEPGRRPPEDDCGAGRDVGDTERARQYGSQGQGIRTDGPSLPSARPGGAERSMADAGHGLFPQPGLRPEERNGAGSAGEVLADADHARLPRPESRELSGAERDYERRAVAELRPAPLELFAPGPADPRWPAILAASPHLAPALSAVEAALAVALQTGTLDLAQEIEPQLHGLVDGTARWILERRVRLQCDGNMVVPLQAAAVFTVLRRRLGI